MPDLCHRRSTMRRTALDRTITTITVLCYQQIKDPEGSLHNLILHLVSILNIFVRHLQQMLIFVDD